MGKKRQKNRQKNRPKKRRPTAAFDHEESLRAALQLHQVGELSLAEDAYRQILLRNPDSSVTRHLLGRLFYQTDRKELAISSLQQAIAGRPDYPDALRDLGNMFHEVGKLEHAEDCFEQLLQLKPNDAMAHNNLGVVYKDQRRLHEAAIEFHRSIELDDRDIGPLLNLGQLFSLQEDWDNAAKIYRKVMKIEPNNIEAHERLASLLRRNGQSAEAADVFASWLKIDPNNPIPRHILSAYSGRTIPERASDEYLINLFDRFATTFDEDLRRLEYRGPQILEQGLLGTLGNPDGSEIVLDAGCGTGLCGAALRPYARRLVGVDISPKMLAAASQLGIYDELVPAELGGYLSDQQSTFDLIASADTFGYFGELTQVFKSAWQALRLDGFLLVTIEIADEAQPQNYRLMSSGRYQHNREYLIRSCESAGFKIQRLNEDVLRKEADQAVPIVLLAAQRT